MEKLSALESGSGDRTLVFLHYFGGSSRTWQPVIHLLQNSFRCIAVDLPGFGDSKPLPPNATVEAMAAKVEESIQDISSYTLIGHSMGGKIALALAARNPAVVDKLMLVAPSPPTPEPMKEESKQQLLSAYGHPSELRKIIESLVCRTLSEEQITQLLSDYARIDHQSWIDWIETASGEDISSQITNLRIPITVISGSDDPNFSTSFLKKIFSSILPQTIFQEVPHAGHLIPIESPELLASLIKELFSH